MVDLLAGTSNLWTIHAIGSPNFMHKVFTAIALLGESGTLGRMGQIGFLVGLFVLVYRVATASGSLMDVRQALVAGVVFAAMFGTSTSVKLVGMVPTPGNPAGADVRIVDHVPWGIAAIGAVVSGTGVYLTRRMETAFRDPDAIPVTQGGFGRTAEILASVRQLSVDSIPNTLPVYDHYKRSMLAYLRDCVMRARQFEVLSDHTIAHAPDPLSAIRWNNGLQQTRSWLPTLAGDGTAIACPDAHQLLQDKAGDMLAGLDPAYRQRFGAGAAESVGRALASVANRGAADAQAYMAGAMINALWLEAASGSSFGGMGNNQTLTIRAALEQRRSQWVAEETAFLKAMRPMIGYFESFFYALSPFIAFLVGLGALGLRMIVKYVALTLAVALWMPVLAITNLYQVTTLQDFFATQEQMAVAAGSGIFSLSNNAALLDQATEAVALASMIAAATPMLTLTLLFGGSVAATSLFSRLQGQDHLNERISTPDPVGPSPVYSATPAYLGNDVSGLRRSGDDANALRFDLSEQMQSSTRQLEAHSRTASVSAAQAWGQAMARSQSLERAFSKALEFQLTDSGAIARNEGAMTLDRLGVDQNERLQAAQSYAQSTELSGQAQINAGASLGRVLDAGVRLFDSVVQGATRSAAGSSSSGDSGASGMPSAAPEPRSSPRSRMADLGAEIRLGGSAKEQGQDSSRMEQSLGDSRQLALQQQKAIDRMMQHAVLEAMRTSTQDGTRHGLSEQTMSQLGRTTTDLAQASRAHEEAEQVAMSFGTSQSVNLLAASERIRQLPAKERRDIDMLARTLGGDEAYAMNLGALRSGQTPGAPVDPEGQRAAAALLTLAGVGPGAAVTEANPGLADLAEARRGALAHALGASQGLATEALRAQIGTWSEGGLAIPGFGETASAVTQAMHQAAAPDLAAVSGGIETTRDAISAARTSIGESRSDLDAGFASEQAAFQADARESLQDSRTSMGAGVVDRMADMNNDAGHMLLAAQQHLSGFTIAERLARDRVEEALDLGNDFGRDLAQYRAEAERHHIHGDTAVAYAAAKYLVEHPGNEFAPVAGSYLRAHVDDAVASGRIEPARAGEIFAKLLVTGELQQADYAALSVYSGGLLAPAASVDDVVGHEGRRDGH